MVCSQPHRKPCPAPQASVPSTFSMFLFLHSLTTCESIDVLALCPLLFEHKQVSQLAFCVQLVHVAVYDPLGNWPLLKASR